MMAHLNLDVSSSTWRILSPEERTEFLEFIETDGALTSLDSPNCGRSAKFHCLLCLPPSTDGGLMLTYEGLMEHLELV